MTRSNRRLNETAGMLMVGDGVLGLVYPEDHCLLWRGGPAWWRSTIDWFAGHPQVTRGFAVLELAAGLWLARRQERRVGQPAAGSREAGLGDAVEQA